MQLDVEHNVGRASSATGTEGCWSSVCICSKNSGQSSSATLAPADLPSS